MFQIWSCSPAKDNQWVLVHWHWHCQTKLQCWHCGTILTMTIATAPLPLRVPIPCVSFENIWWGIRIQTPFNCNPRRSCFVLVGFLNVWALDLSAMVFSFNNISRSGSSCEMWHLTSRETLPLFECLRGVMDGRTASNEIRQDWSTCSDLNQNWVRHQG